MYMYVVYLIRYFIVFINNITFVFIVNFQMYIEVANTACNTDSRGL